jgi:hypothetical protein
MRFVSMNTAGTETQQEPSAAFLGHPFVFLQTASSDLPRQIIGIKGSGQQFRKVADGARSIDQVDENDGRIETELSEKLTTCPTRWNSANACNRYPSPFAMASGNSCRCSGSLGT